MKGYKTQLHTSKKIYKLPDFIIVGTIKSGTTTVWEFLKNHSEVFMPEIKETRFFSDMNLFRGGKNEPQNNKIENLKDYIGLFNKSSNKVCGDISNDYFFYYKKTISNIKKTYKHYNCKFPKIIIILRDPYDQANSLYNQLKSMYGFKETFDEMICKETYYREKNFPWPFYLKKCCLASDPLNAYLQNFKDVQILFFDDINKKKFQIDLCNFLGISKTNRKMGNLNKTLYSKFEFLNILYRLCLTINKNFGFLFPQSFKKYIKFIFYNFRYQKKDNMIIKDISDDIYKVKKILDKYKGRVL